MRRLLLRTQGLLGRLLARVLRRYPRPPSALESLAEVMKSLVRESEALVAEAVAQTRQR